MGKPNKEKGTMTVVEAGRRGGRKVREMYGREFYSEIGRKGGKQSPKKKKQSK